MTNLAPDTSTWHETLRRVSDPTQLKALGAKSFAVLAVSLLLAVAGLALALSGISWSGWILAALGLLSAGVWGMMLANNRAASKFTGDDLIEIVVADEGVIVQGGLAVTWDEILDIQYEWNKTVVGGNVTAALTGAAVGKAFEAAGIDTVVKAFKVRLKNYKPVKARAQSKIQRLVVFEAMLGDPGYLHVGQGGRSPEEMNELLAALTTQSERHGVPLTQVNP